MAEIKEVVKIEVNTSEALKQLIKYRQELEKVKKQRQDLLAKGEALTDSERQELEKLTQQQKLYTAEVRNREKAVQNTAKAESSLYQNTLAGKRAELAAEKEKLSYMGLTEDEINEFLNNVSEAGLVYVRAIDTYLSKGANDEFMKKRQEVTAFEMRNDQLRRDVEATLYEHTLLPDSRADVLQLLEAIDRVMNKYESNLYMYAIERPDIPKVFHDAFAELVQTVVDCVEALVVSARSFFEMNGEIKNHLHKVMFFEKQADQQGTILKTAFFDNKKLSLAHQRQLQDFEMATENISDLSEDVADTLTVLTVKRSF